MPHTQHEGWQPDGELLRLLVDNVTDYAIFVLDVHGNVASWNPGAERIKGYKADQIIGQHFSRFYPQEAVDRGWPAHELSVAAAEGHFEDEGWRLRKDGSPFWANVVITALRDEAGNLRGFSKITRDLSARKQAEEHARQLVAETTARQVAEENARIIAEQRERLHVTLASIGDAVVSTNSEGHIEFLNPVAEQLLGWTAEEAEDRPLLEIFRIVNEETRAPVDNPALRALRENVVIGLANHTVLISKDGTERPIDDCGAPIRDRKNNVIGSVLVFRDISERRAAQARIREQQEWLRVTLASIGDAVIATDVEGRITFLNSVAQELTGWSQEEATGKPLETVFAILEEHTRNPVEHPVAKAIREGKIAGLGNHTILIAKDGTERPIDDSAAPIRDDKGRILGVVLIFRDATEQRRTEEYRNARLAATHGLSEADSIDSGARSVLQAVCENLGWDVGIFWAPNPEQPALRCQQSWSQQDLSVEAFTQASCDRGFAPNEGLPGRVWSTSKPAWILDIAQDQNFPRRVPALQCGLKSAFACPVIVGPQTLGVIEFFTRQVRETDENLLELITTVAGTLGQFIQRRVATEDLQQSGEELSDFFDNATVGLHWVGPDGTILRANQAELDMLGYSREEYVGRNIAEFHVSQAVIEGILECLTAGQRLTNHPAQMRCKDGTIKDVLIDSSVLFKNNRFIHTRCFTRDVTAQKRMEAALRHSEQRLAAELEAMTRLHALSSRVLAAENLETALDDVLQEAIAASRADFGNIQLYNPQNHALEIVAQRSFPQEFLDYFRTVRLDEGSACAQAMQMGERIIIEDVTVDPSFAPHRQIASATGFLAVQSTPLKSRRGNIVGMLSTHFRQPHRPTERDEQLLDLLARQAADLIERRGFEEALRHSEKQFRQLADAMPQIVWSAGADGKIDYLNQRWTEFTGLPQTSGNESWRPFLHPDEAPAASARWAASVANGTRFDMELRLLDRHSQSYRWHLIRTIATKDDAGNIIRWFGTSTDIHEQKRAEESARYLAEASAALARVVDYRSTLQKVANLAIPYFADWAAVDVMEDGVFQRLAVAHQDSSKLSIAQQMLNEYPPDVNAAVGAYSVIRTGNPEFVSDIPEELLVRSAKDERHLSLIRSLGLKSYICVPLMVSGKMFGVLTFATAESGRQYTQADLSVAIDLANRAAVAVENTQLYQALRETDRRKDEFLATLAHELRNPLAPIRNSLQILKMPRLDAETIDRSRDMMERQVHHLVRLVDDLLDVSRVMRGKIELRKERVELASIIARAVETAQPLIEAQGHRLTMNIPPDSLPVDADPVRLAQVIGNLLTNAAKYTERNGHIWLTATRDGNFAELRVRDTGIGIAPDMLPHVFELFVQADHGAARAQGGLGIGLTLVKNLVEMHYGAVEAHSEGLGKGCEFVVRLPLSAALLDQRAGEGGEQQLIEQAAPSGYRVMVVDDNQDAANSLGMLLRFQGHDVRVAYNGMSALEIADEYKPNVVFLDIGMPKMDGYEVARRFRQQPGLENVVLAALTGWGQQEDRRRTAEAGFNHHLVKPPEQDLLDDVFTQLRRIST